MVLLYWLVFGLVVGAIANLIDPTPSRGGILGSMVLGIVGAIIGGGLGSVFLGLTVTGFNVTSLLLALGGALLVLFLSRALSRV